MLSFVLPTLPLIVIAMLILLTKHLMADFFFQTPYMLRKTQPVGWKLPLLTHCSVHAAFTLLGLLFICSPLLALKLAVLDGGVHFGVDTWKAQYTHYTPNQPMFWYSLGFDQWLHQLTYLAITVMALPVF